MSDELSTAACAFALLQEKVRELRDHFVGAAVGGVSVRTDGPDSGTKLGWKPPDLETSCDRF